MHEYYFRRKFLLLENKIIFLLCSKINISEFLKETILIIIIRININHDSQKLHLDTIERIVMVLLFLH